MWKNGMRPVFIGRMPFFMLCLGPEENVGNTSSNMWNSGDAVVRRSRAVNRRMSSG